MSRSQNIGQAVWRWERRISRQSEETWLARVQADFDDETAAQLIVCGMSGRKTVLLQLYSTGKLLPSRLELSYGGSICLVRACEWLKPANREPVRVSRKIWVTGARDSYLPESAPVDARCLVIPASIAFGTGDHATTGMVLRAMGRDFPKRQPSSVTDLGTGTGVLALAAVALGADQVIGMDNDTNAIRLCHENAALNLRSNEAGIRWEHCELARFRTRRADVVLANIFAEVLINHCRKVLSLVRKDGWLYLTGILSRSEGQVLEAYGTAGCRLLERKRSGRWVFLKYECSG